MSALQLGFFDQSKVINQKRRIKKITIEAQDDNHINDIIKLQMPFFEKYYLNYHIEAVREELKCNNIPEISRVEVLFHFSAITRDIAECFRISSPEERQMIIDRFEEALKECINHTPEDWEIDGDQIIIIDEDTKASINQIARDENITSSEALRMMVKNYSINNKHTPR